LLPRLGKGFPNIAILGFDAFAAGHPTGQVPGIPIDHRATPCDNGNRVSPQGFGVRCRTTHRYTGHAKGDADLERGVGNPMKGNNMHDQPRRVLPDPGIRSRRQPDAIRCASIDAYRRWLSLNDAGVADPELRAVAAHWMKTKPMSRTGERLVQDRRSRWPRHNAATLKKLVQITAPSLQLAHGKLGTLLPKMSAADDGHVQRTQHTSRLPEMR
jgi:hypothetical protein